MVCGLRGCQGGTQASTPVAGEPTYSLILYQAGCSPSFSSLVKAGLKEGLVHEMNRVWWKWRPAEKAPFSG